MMQKFTCFSPSESIDYFVCDLHNVVNWSNLWQLSISIPKTFILHTGNKNPQHNYHVRNQTLENKETIKDLGIYVTSTLSCSYHCSEIAKKANSRKFRTTCFQEYRY